MTQENEETGFDVRKPLAAEGCVKFPNGVRPTIRFVDETTESRLKDAREQMTFTRAKKTIRRTGWYFTENYAPCGIEGTTKFEGLDAYKLNTLFGA